MVELMANDESRRSHRALLDAAWEEFRVTSQTSGESAESTIANWRGPTRHFKRQELGLQSGDISIVHTLANLTAINKRNRVQLAQREGAGLAADKKRIKRKRVDKVARAKAARKILSRAGVKMRAGELVRIK